MESDARYAWVGLAVVTLMVAIAAGFYWLRGGNEQEVSRFTVYFQNQSLEGLQLNSNVRMQGIKVGKVVDYTIQPDKAGTVRVILEVDARTPVWEGAEAVVTRNLVTGLAVVDLDNVWKGGAAIGPPPKGEPYPVIDEGVPQMARISSTLEGLGKTGSEAVLRVNKLLSDENQKAFSAILGNVAGVTGDLRKLNKELGPELHATLGAARQAAVRLESVAAELKPVLRDGGQLAQQAGKRLDKLALDAETTLNATRKTLNSMDTSLRDMQAQLRLSVDLGMQEIQTTAQALRMSSEAVQTTSREFSDPGRILFGPHKSELGPGEQ
jgi:phospholipid/cholesterol/gamma-HCH transport system substrate-binding protein